MQTKPTPRRGYGSGSLTVKTDAVGTESWYGLWYSGGKRVKRRLGAKRSRGSHDGLTRPQAEARLRELIGETTVQATGERLTIAEVARRYLFAAERMRRKPSTLENIESEVRVHLAPFFGDRSLDRITPEDVADLIASSRAPGSRRKRFTTSSARSRRCSTSPRRHAGAGRPRTHASALSFRRSPRRQRSGS